MLDNRVEAVKFLLTDIVVFVERRVQNEFW